MRRHTVVTEAAVVAARHPAARPSAMARHAVPPPEEPLSQDLVARSSSAALVTAIRSTEMGAIRTMGTGDIPTTATDATRTTGTATPPSRLDSASDIRTTAT